MKKKLIVLSGLLSLTPMMAFAQTLGSCSSTTGGSGVATVSDLFCKILLILNSVLPVLVALGVVYFVWGVVTYVISSDEEAKKAGRDRIIFGIIGLAVIIGVWGLVGILKNTFSLNNNTNGVFSLPTVNQ